MWNHNPPHTHLEVSRLLDECNFMSINVCVIFSASAYGVKLVKTTRWQCFHTFFQQPLQLCSTDIVL